MKKRGLLLVTGLVFIALILCAYEGCSTFHPIVFWDGGYPSNQFHIHVTDSKCIPIKSAILSVVDKSDEPAYGYPIEEFSEELLPQADDSGTITVHHTGGIEFGGSYKLLFGVIRYGRQPSSDSPPEYYLHITAPGYRETTLKYTEIVDVKNVIVEKTVVLKEK